MHFFSSFDKTVCECCRFTGRYDSALTYDVIVTLRCLLTVGRAWSNATVVVVIDIMSG